MYLLLHSKHDALQLVIQHFSNNINIYLQCSFEATTIQCNIQLETNLTIGGFPNTAGKGNYETNKRNFKNDVYF